MSALSKDFDLATWSGDPKDAPYIIVADARDGGQDIRVYDLTVRIPDKNETALVENLNLTIPKGSRVVLTGEAGSGKTVTAKALMNQHFEGNGLIVMPAGTKKMMISQQAYFANTTIRGILNNTPEDSAHFKDEDLAGALHTVGHDKLIQHVPGQQALILMHDLLPQIGDAFRPFSGSGIIADFDLEKAEKDIVEKAAALAKQQFSVVQYVPDAQRVFFREQLEKTLKNALNMPLLNSDMDRVMDRIANAVLDRIDIELVRPLTEHLSGIATQVAAAEREKLVGMTPRKGSYFAHALENSLARHVRKYMANLDTDDAQRPIRINQAQAAHVVKTAAQTMKEGLQGKRNLLSQAFNAATWPLSVATLQVKAGAMATAMTDSLAFFMDKQVLTGDKLTLSGGEKNKLMMAMVLLHKPDVLILDEITAALDRQTGEKLYKEMMDQIPAGTTVISIAHNEHIVKYHTHHAHLADKTITLTSLPLAGPSAPKP